MCASEMIEHRKNSWELYGFDFMVDDEYNAWLIEINSSPACDYSTTVTERYVQKALVELLSVVLDTRDWEAQPRKSRGPSPDTGGWERIYQGPLLDMPVGSFGTEMSLKGEAYKNLPPRPSVNVGASLNIITFQPSQQQQQQSTTTSAKQLRVAPVAGQAPSSPLRKQTFDNAGNALLQRQLVSPTAAAGARSPSSKVDGEGDAQLQTGGGGGGGYGNDNGDAENGNDVDGDSDQFDDSDEDGSLAAAGGGSAGEGKAGRGRGRGTGRGTTDKNSVDPATAPFAAQGSNSILTKAHVSIKANKMLVPTVASIPIKTFSVEF
jgi:hypothetical protein